MKVTGYGLLALAAVLCAYAAICHLVFDVTAVERSGAGNALTHMSNGSYWLALIPATAAAAIGFYLLFSPQRGYATTYDMTRQQTPWQA